MVNTTPIQIITLVLVFFVLVRLYFRVRNKEISLRAALIWGGLWLGTIIVVLYPGLADEVAHFLGLETATGIDFVAYVSVGMLFYLLLLFWLRLDRMEQNITKIVRHMALLEDKSQNRH